MDSKTLMVAAVGGVVGSIATLAAVHLAHGTGGGCCGASKEITRKFTADPRMSGLVIHNSTVYLSGQVGEIEKLDTSDVKKQTEQTLAKIVDLLKEAGSSKSKILEARVWLKDINKDFAAFNEVWNAWVDPNNKGVRYCVESPMARPSILVEIQVVAAQ